MASRPRASLALVAVASVVVAGALAAAPAPAARPAEPGGGGGDAHPRLPGKGDTDGDKIADDLEAARSTAGPGDRVRVIVQGTTVARARTAAPSLEVGRLFH